MAFRKKKRFSNVISHSVKRIDYAPHSYNSGSFGRYIVSSTEFHFEKCVSIMQVASTMIDILSVLSEVTQEPILPPKNSTGINKKRNPLRKKEGISAEGLILRCESRVHSVKQ